MGLSTSLACDLTSLQIFVFYVQYCCIVLHVWLLLLVVYAFRHESLEL